MKRWLSIIIFLTSGLFAFAQNSGDPKFFLGGKSDISNSDSERATKAIQKWSAAEGKQGDALLSAAPYYWDSKVVGRPVFLRIIKNNSLAGRLEVWLENPKSKQFEHYKTYHIAYFSGKLGPKTKQGDGQAPEGFYTMSRGQLNPLSRFHLSMDMGYPNAYDRAHKRTGSYLMIHGSFVSVGCYAMTDCSIEQIYTLVSKALSKGQSSVKVHAFPFEMTSENLEKHKESPHYEFWKNLKEGWDWFEAQKQPPTVQVAEDKYIFTAGRSSR